MGVDVVLMRVEQKGTSPKGRRVYEVDAVVDLDGEFARLCEGARTKILSRVDPYGDLVLEPGDMPELLSELADLEAEYPEATLRLAEVAAIARRCREAVWNAELLFLGD